MTLMTDWQIKEALAAGNIIMDPPPKDEDIQPTSVDVHLGDTFKQFMPGETGSFDSWSIDANQIMYELDERAHLLNPNGAEYIVLESFGFILGMIAESLTLAPDIACRIEGKSSLGRLGILVHATAGFVDPGWSGNLTIELANISPVDWNLKVGQKVSQFCFYRLDGPVTRPYGSAELGSRYHGQRSPGASQGSDPS